MSSCKPEDNSPQKLLDSSRGAGGSYILSPAALRHTGVYVCRAERGQPAYQTEFSKPQPLLVTGVSPNASVSIHSNWTQIFTYEPLSLSCEAQGNSTGRRLRWITGWTEQRRCPSGWTEGGSTCSTSSAHSFDSGVYWCQSESGEQSNPVNITVHDGNVILESPVHPVTEGDPLTLRCTYRRQPSNISADFHKDGTLLHTSSTGEMTIPAVSKSHEGLYKCSNPERGESPGSWITVMRTTRGSFTLKLNHQPQQQSTNQSSVQGQGTNQSSVQSTNQSSGSDSVYMPLQTSKKGPFTFTLLYYCVLCMWLTFYYNLFSSCNSLISHRKRRRL
ncbi:hypothetical protein ACEWY4_024944 [Coilia grayii]|uniref:Ig-like domain-containing protein n=1 Tax=Coilia grayii TaxID=363190 RepID=A0ABD1IYV1_9TELE